MAPLSSFLRTFFTLSLCLPSALSHMQMESPSPIRDPHSNRVQEPKDYNILNPLKPDGSDFTCKGYQWNTPLTPVATYYAGDTYTLRLRGGATHGGGSCQISLSCDNGVTFRVLKSIIGGCPITKQYNFTVPEYARSGQCLLGWTWFNKIGNREMYMNCAVVKIIGAEDDDWYYYERKRLARDGNAVATDNTNMAAQKALEKLPSLYVANLAGINSCTTKETTDVVFDDPGDDVEYGDDSAAAQQTSWSRVKRGSSRCTGVAKKASGGASSPSASPSSPSASPSSPSEDSDPSWSDSQDSGDTSSTPVSTKAGSGSTKPANCNDGQWHPECYSRESSSSSNLPKTNAEAKSEVEKAKQESPEGDGGYGPSNKSPKATNRKGSDKYWDTYNPDYEYYYGDDNYRDDDEYSYEDEGSDYGTWNARRQQEPPTDISAPEGPRVGALQGFSWPTRTAEDEPTSAVDVPDSPVIPTPTEVDVEPVIEPVIGDATSTEIPSTLDLPYPPDDMETSTQWEELWEPTPIEPPATDIPSYPTTLIPVDRPVPIISGVNDIPIPEITGISTTFTDEILVDPLRPTSDVSAPTTELVDDFLDLISPEDGYEGYDYEDWDDGFDYYNEFDPGWADSEQTWQSTDAPIDFDPQTGEFGPWARQVVDPAIGAVEPSEKVSACTPTPSVNSYDDLAPLPTTSCSDPQWYCDGCSAPNRCVKINPCTRSCTRLPYTTTAATEAPEPEATVFLPAVESYNVSTPSLPTPSTTGCEPSYADGDLSPYLPCEPGTLLCKSPTQFYTCGPFGPGGEWGYSESRDVTAGMKCEPALVSAGLVQAQRISRMLMKKRQDDQGDDEGDWYYVDVPEGENTDDNEDWGVEGVDWYWADDSSPSSSAPPTPSPTPKLQPGGGIPIEPGFKPYRTDPTVGLTANDGAADYNAVLALFGEEPEGYSDYWPSYDLSAPEDQGGKGAGRVKPGVRPGAKPGRNGARPGATSTTTSAAPAAATSSAVLHSTTVASSASATASAKAAVLRGRKRQDSVDGEGGDSVAAKVLPWFLGPGPMNPPGVDLQGEWPGLPVPQNQDGDGDGDGCSGEGAEDVVSEVRTGKRKVVRRWAKRQSERCAAVPEGYYRSDRYIAA